mmetsp:Transcript_461/g.646  ORF Transcript_461/g.646 Transcript_461/m.646 type:complete len:237 (+) Transcript_461:121-831(+)
MAKPDKVSSSSSNKEEKDTVFINNSQSLQEALHTLLTRLSETSEIIQKWPEPESNSDHESIHAETTTKLIKSIHKVVNGIRLVEEKVNPNLGDEKPSEQHIALANNLRQTAVPLDLLDMMDYAGGLNPDCFARGLLIEALQQFSNLSNRKSSMTMLANLVQHVSNPEQALGQVVDRKAEETKLKEESKDNNSGSDTGQVDEDGEDSQDALSSGKRKRGSDYNNDQEIESQQPPAKR